MHSLSEVKCGHVVMNYGAAYFICPIGTGSNSPLLVEWLLFSLIILLLFLPPVVYFIILKRALPAPWLVFSR